jgi:hypothetical protein
MLDSLVRVSRRVPKASQIYRIVNRMHAISATINPLTGRQYETQNKLQA